jgi:hypothetical protein
MNTRMILASLITAATLAACSNAPQISTLEDLGTQPTLEELNADNDSSVELAGTTNGLGNLLMRKIYDSNQNGKRDEDEPGIPDWGVRIVSVDDNGNPDDAADIQVTPQGSGRWRGVNLKVPFGRYKIEELEPITTKQTGVVWKVTGKPSRTVNVSRSNPLRAIEFAGVCLENGAVVKFPKIADFGDWKCHATFDLLPRISSFTATPNQVQTGGSSVLAWNVLDYSRLEITPGVGAVTGFTGSKTVSPSSTTSYTLKATNGFGSRTASATLSVGSASGKWSTVGNLKFVSGNIFIPVLPLGSDRFIITDGIKSELYDFKTGSSKELKNYVPGAYPIVRASKVLSLRPQNFLETSYDPDTDTVGSINTGLTVTALDQLQGDTYLGFDFGSANSGKISFGLIDVSTYAYTPKVTDFKVVFADPGSPIATRFVGLTKEHNALFVSVQYVNLVTASVALVQAQALVFNPRTGQLVSSTKMSEPNCFFLSVSDFGTATFGKGVLLNNGHLLRAGGYSFRGGALSSFCDYDPSTNISVMGQANQLSSGFDNVALNNGQAMVLRDSAVAVSSNNPFDFDGAADLYDPLRQAFTLTSPFVQPRRYSKSAQLSDGRVLIFGGVKPRSPLEPTSTPAVPLSSIEVYTP